MRPFLTESGREFYQIRLDSPKAIEFSSSEPYVCLLWDHAGNWSDVERNALVSSLLQTSCRYAVCGGINCERWHDDIDLAFVTTVPESEQDARFVMTTWHTDEPALEVAWFFAWNAGLEDEFRRFLVVEVGNDATHASLEVAVRRAVTESEAVLDELDQGAG